MYLIMLLSLINIPTEFVQIFPFTFIISLSVGISQFVEKNYFALFLQEIKNYLLLMVISSLALLYFTGVQIPDASIIQSSTLSLESYIKIYLQLSLFYSILKISKHAYFLIYNTKQYVTYNIEKYLKEIPFGSDYKKIIGKNIRNLVVKTKLQKKYQRFMNNVLKQNKTNPLIRQKMYDAHIYFIYNNHIVLKTWSEVDKNLKCKLENGSFKEIFVNKEVIFPPVLPRIV
jgi:hypothetical protein